MKGRRAPRTPAHVEVAVTSGHATTARTAPTRRRSRELHPPDLWHVSQLAAIVLAVSLGLAAALDPQLAIAIVIGMIVVGVVMSNVTVGVLVLVFVAYLESLPNIAGAPSLSKLVGIFLVVGWLAAVTTGRGEERASRDLLARNPLLVWVLGLFLAWVLFSLLWAEDVAIGKETFFRFALNATLFPIVFVAIRETRHVVWLYSAIVAGGLLTVAVGMVTGGTADRLYGAGLNPNELGGLTATATILAAVLACNRSFSLPARVVAVSASGLCAISTMLTGSRGSFLGLAAALLVAPIVAGRGRRLSAAALVAGAALAILVWLMLFAPASTSSRLIHTTATGGSGRSDLWEISLRMVEDKPLYGVGAGNFPVASVHYLLEPGAIVKAEYIVDRPQQTHNIYLQVLSELGVVGLALFAGIISTCLACALRAARAFRQRGDPSAELLARGLVIALTGLLVTDAFTTNIYSKQLYVLLATGPALLAIARRGQTSSR